MAFAPSEKIRAATLNSYIASGDYSTYAEYNMAATQTIPDSTGVIVFFGYQNRASPLVAQSVDGAGHRFTLNRAGLWAITATLRWASSSNGSRYSAINSSDNVVASQDDMLGTSGLTGPPTSNISLNRRFALGAWVRVEVFQNNAGGSRDLEANNGTGWGRLNLAWIHA